MTPIVVEVVAQCRHQIVGMAQTVEHVFVQTFIPHPAIDALYGSILHRLTGSDIMPVVLSVFLPFQDYITGQFGAVVADRQAGVSSQRRDLVQISGDTVT